MNITCYARVFTKHKKYVTEVFNQRWHIVCKEGRVYLNKAEDFYSNLGVYIKEMQRQEVAVLCSICDIVVCTVMKAVCRKVQSSKEQSGNTVHSGNTMNYGNTMNSGNTVHCEMKCVTSLLTLS